VSELQIREARASDVPRIAVVFREARTTAMPWLPVLHSSSEDLEFFGRLVQAGHVEVGVLDGRVLGFVAVDRDAHMLDHLYLDPSVQRRGYGRELLDRARAAHDGPLELRAFRENHGAPAFYAACGARELYETDGSGNEERTPDVRLALPAWDGQPVDDQ
jgi:GNAT superfamily N-acetyltransferase